VAAAKAQAKQMLDEATTRASAIHDGAERRLTLLTSRHTETMRRLTEIRDVVTNLVASEVARGSLEEEVAKSVAKVAAAGGGVQAPPARAVDPAQARHPAAVQPGRPGGPAGPVGRDISAERERGIPETTRPSPGHLAQHAAAPAEERPGRAAPAPTRNAPTAPGAPATSDGGRKIPD
jgi:hypothetical protein